MIGKFGNGSTRLAAAALRMAALAILDPPTETAATPVRDRKRRMPRSYNRPGKSVQAANHKKNGGRSHNRRRSR